MSTVVVWLKMLVSSVFVFLFLYSGNTRSDEAIPASSKNQKHDDEYEIDIEKIVRQASSMINNNIKQFSLPLYRAYFDMVSENTLLHPLHENYRSVFEKLGISTRLIRVGYSSYLASAVNTVAMTDCNDIYFPAKSLVDKISTGKKISKKQMHLLLHEVGHTRQCQASTREMYAQQWFNDLSPAAMTALKAGKLEAKLIHDAMPLEIEAENFAKKMIAEVIKH